MWTISGERMKAKEPHRVPLSAATLAVVKTLKEQKQQETLVFPSPRGKLLSNMTLTTLLRRVKANDDKRGDARDLAERALGRTVANGKFFHCMNRRG
ncbi:hypothetical protein LJ655_05940 [Paraburkholderia sp. MMS20-SJTN17]|uniref:Tyr recombinase domain-containing protein n=1 Tax=Paraburkholderia translucens TaxID=2886945 RepID=A0ABS8KAC6_9BURK|nr:hypothetical protein [Paraburkholderia sp. MMS20-SJTN17]